MIQRDLARQGGKRDAHPVRRFRRILLATDFSAPSRAAWKEAVQMASAGGNLLIACVLRLPAPFSPGGLLLPQASDELQAALRRDAERAMRSLLKQTRKARVTATGVLLTGREEEAIARAARRHKADLVVVGTHGR